MWESHQSSHAILVKTANKYNYQNVWMLIFLFDVLSVTDEWHVCTYSSLLVSVWADNVGVRTKTQLSSVSLSALRTATRRFTSQPRRIRWRSPPRCWSTAPPPTRWHARESRLCTSRRRKATWTSWRCCWLETRPSTWAIRFDIRVKELSLCGCHTGRQRPQHEFYYMCLIFIIIIHLIATF